MLGYILFLWATEHCSRGNICSITELVNIGYVPVNSINLLGSLGKPGTHFGKEGEHPFFTNVLELDRKGFSYPKDIFKIVYMFQNKSETSQCKSEKESEREVQVSVLHD